ncbi:T9SS type A sorting domain-containing protein [Flammeovirga sp. MY04]|uniref:T9SS type A sorting domain-containing protein n=1 Tax=Flammeovirga sp. MY04 TaxID=1191459 RepID=UPI00080612A4|nr:T9SS type A sorting domain-containing protein [Flammeovirga sp. MY04]ANQ52534.1 T9SS type A sorting domain-containing protein [Flammeovirga sp. MY04]
MKIFLPFALILFCITVSNAQPIIGPDHSEIFPDEEIDQTIGENEYMDLTTGSYNYNENGEKSITLEENSILFIRSGVNLEVSKLSVKKTAVLYVERGATVIINKDFIYESTGESEIHSLYFYAKYKIQIDKDEYKLGGTGRITYTGSDYTVSSSGTSICIGTEDPEFYDPDHDDFGDSGVEACNTNGNSAQYIADLPVKMIFFESVINNNIVTLNWATAAEQDASHFTILRSTDKMNWEEIGEVEAGGNTNFRQDYSFIDTPEKYSTVLYYKLQQFDYDGKNESFGPLTVNLIAVNTMSAQVYPNPTKDKLNLSVGGLILGDQLSISLIDKLGKAVYQEHQDVSGNSLVYNINNISGLQSGHYLLILTSGSQKVVRRFIKQ